MEMNSYKWPLKEVHLPFNTGLKLKKFFFQSTLFDTKICLVLPFQNRTKNLHEDLPLSIFTPLLRLTSSNKVFLLYSCYGSLLPL